jgi:hypothetical protein
MLITAVDWSVSWEIEVLVESLLAAKGPIAILTLVHLSVG